MTSLSEEEDFSERCREVLEHGDTCLVHASLLRER